MASIAGLKMRFRNVSREVRKRTTQPIFGNTLPVATNMAYRRLMNESLEAFDGRVSRRSELRERGFEIVSGVMSPERAAEISARLSVAAKDESAIHKAPTWEGAFFSWLYPIDVLGAEIFDVLDGKLNEALLAFFQSYYCAMTIGAFRTYPTPLSKQGSYLWHSDNYPANVCKVMIYLTRTDAKGGGTMFLDHDCSQRLLRVGYDGAVTKKRQDDLSQIAARNGIPFAPIKADLEPGDAVLFQPNCLHKGIAPSEGFRDVIDMMFLPSPVSWREALKRADLKKIQRNTEALDRWNVLMQQAKAMHVG